MRLPKQFVAAVLLATCLYHRLVGLGFGLRINIGTLIKHYKTCSKRRQALKKREAGFNSNCLNDKLPKYNALVDPNLRHHFESRARQKQLLKIGLVWSNALLYQIFYSAETCVTVCQNTLLRRSIMKGELLTSPKIRQK